MAQVNLKNTHVKFGSSFESALGASKFDLHSTGWVQGGLKFYGLGLVGG